MALDYLGKCGSQLPCSVYFGLPVMGSGKCLKEITKTR